MKRACPDGDRLFFPARTDAVLAVKRSWRMTGCLSPRGKETTQGENTL